MKLRKKVRAGSKYKRQYDISKTPYQRAMECEEVPKEKKEVLSKLYAKLDPVKLKKAIEKKVIRISKTVRPEKS